MKERFEVKLSGAGGQGMGLAGLILAEAAGIYDGRYITQTRSYGPEARGGASKSEIVISTSEIDYPKVMQPDLLLAMTQEAYDRYYQDLRVEGILIVDSFHVTRLRLNKEIKIPITPIAKFELGNELFANVVALGIIVEFSSLVSQEAIEQAVLARAPRGTETKNKQALKIGFAAAQKYKRGEEIKY